MKVLRARVYDMLQSEAQAEYDSNRKLAVGTGDRSERIRTYNYPQNRDAGAGRRRPLMRPGLLVINPVLPGENQPCGFGKIRRGDFPEMREIALNGRMGGPGRDLIKCGLIFHFGAQQAFYFHRRGE